jgi:hypothetical protein
MIPKVGKFYYIDYEDKDQPEGSFFGIARCVKIYDRDEVGRPIAPALYEFEHNGKDGKMELSLFFASEVVMEAQ